VYYRHIEIFTNNSMYATIFILILMMSNLCESNSILICDVGTYKAPPALTDNICKSFAIHGVSAITIGAGSYVQGGGNVGMYPGLSITGIPIFEGGGSIVGDSSLFAAHVTDMWATMIAIQVNERDIAADVGGFVFTPGTYRSIGAITLAAGNVVTLDGLYESNPVFIFKCGTLAFGASISVILRNGARPEHVLWVVEAAAAVGATSLVQGSMLCGAAVVFGAGSELHGCVLGGAAVTFGAGAIIAVHTPGKCQACPPGTNSSTASTVVEDCRCIVGHTAQLDGVLCVECEAGTFKPIPGVGACSSCPTGTSSSLGSDNVDQCICTAGHTSMFDGMECTACKAGTYKSVSGTQMCSVCPRGTSSVVGSTDSMDCICRAGYVADSDGTECTACEAGKYKEKIGSGMPVVVKVERALTADICGTFALHARFSATIASGTIVHGGDVGVSPGVALTGTPIFQGGGKVVSDSTLFAESVMANQVAMMTIRKDGHIIAVGIGGFTFTPGTYRSVGGIVVDAGTIVTLDGLNEANPQFLFQSTTLAFGAGASVVLTNGARPEHVLWVAASIVTVGADSFVKGSILGGAAIGFGAGTQIQGCVLAQSTVTLGAICYIEFQKIPDEKAPDIVDTEG
jgi:hypothetical protein